MTTTAGMLQPRACGVTAADGGPGGTMEWERVATVVRRDIVSGVIPPGIRLASRDVKARHGCTTGEARTAMDALEEEGLLRRPRYGSWWTGIEDRAADTRMGAAMARLRQDAGLTFDDLAAVTGIDPATIAAAEDGAWQPRDTWQRLDEAISAGGGLLRLHDESYASPPPGVRRAAPARADESLPARPAPREHRHTRVTAELRVRITSGEWAPGDRLPYLAALADDHDTTVVGVKPALRGEKHHGIREHPCRAGR